MALGTVTPVAADSHGLTNPVAIGDVKMTINTVVGEASYTTGGASITAAQLGLSTLLAVLATIQDSSGSNATGVLMSPQVQTGGGSALLKTFTNAGVQIGSAVNVSGITWQLVAFGY